VCKRTVQFSSLGRSVALLTHMAAKSLTKACSGEVNNLFPFSSPEEMY
jgi:hypothetical protein